MTQYLIIKIALVFLGSLIFSILINRIFLKFSKNLGIRNIDEAAIRWASAHKPAFGGISFFILFLLILSSYQIAFPLQNSPFNFELIGLILAGSIGFLIGLADDAFNTNPILKLLGQTLCALILISTGTFIEIFEQQWINYLITAVWVVGMMNSINMLDNMDAVATIASIFAFCSFIVVLLSNSAFSSIYFLMTIGMVGALLGFLFFNWNPSKMYMGDTGSQFLGIILSALSIKLLWNFGSPDIQLTSKQFLLPLLAFLVPICDTTTVTINRLAKGKSPFIGGKDHTTHHLSYLGLSDQSVALIIAGISMISTVILAVCISLENWSHLFTIIFSLYAIIVFLSLFLTTKVKVSHSKKSVSEKPQIDKPN